jgi:hypothetical protein
VLRGSIDAKRDRYGIRKSSGERLEYHPQAKAAKDFIGAALKLREGLRRKEGSFS